MKTIKEVVLSFGMTSGLQENDTIKKVHTSHIYQIIKGISTNKFKKK
jgi:hypothetical protein